jgi:hypothetical protein
VECDKHQPTTANSAYQPVHGLRGEVKIVYLEVPWPQWKTQNANRQHAVPEEVILRMSSRLEVPQPDEAHCVEYRVRMHNLRASSQEALLVLFHDTKNFEGYFRGHAWRHRTGYPLFTIGKFTRER